MLELAQYENIEIAVMMDISGACGSQVIYDGNKFSENKKYQIGMGVCAAQLVKNGFKVISQRDFASLEILYSKIDPTHTINGDVDITYTKNPVQPCKFYTLNGDINAWFQKGLAAELSFESFNGNFFTNVQKLESMPVEVEKKQTDNGMKYKVNGNRFKVGTGGVRLDFETFNGNVYLKETTN